MGAPTVLKDVRFYLPLQKVHVNIAGSVYRPGDKDVSHTGHMTWSYEDGTTREFIIDDAMWKWIEDVLYPLAYWEEQADSLNFVLADKYEIKAREYISHITTDPQEISEILEREED